MKLELITGAPQREALAAALLDADLPADDIVDPGRTFYLVRDAGVPSGYVGLEGIGADRLLRSLIVLPPSRGKGIGQKALGLVEEVASKDGCERLHLLTTTAAKFFAANGYAESDRAHAPDGIRRSREFSELCPASATYMVKSL